MTPEPAPGRVRARWWCRHCDKYGGWFLVDEDRWTQVVAWRHDDHVRRFHARRRPRRTNR